MALTTKTAQLGPDLYQIESLPTSVGLPIYSRLIKALGPVARGIMTDAAMRKLVAEAQASGETVEVLARQSAAAHQLGQRFMVLLVEAVEALPTEFLLELARTFSQVSKVTTKDSNGIALPLSDQNLFDQHFACRYWHLTKFIVEHITLNFSDFLGNLAASVARGQAA